MQIKHLFLALAALALAIILPLFYREILFFLVGKVNLSWLLSNILLRLAVILLFAAFLHYTLRFLLKNRRLRFGWTLLIALLPGFGLSFIYPIYNIDFGTLGNDFKMTDREYLDPYLVSEKSTGTKHSLYIFFTTTCPHCKEASERLGTNLEGGQKIPVYAFFPSTQADAEKFLSTYNGTEFHYGLVDNDSAFVAISGGAFPSAFLLDENGQTLNHWTGDELNYTALDYLKSLE